MRNSSLAISASNTYPIFVF